MAPGKNVADKAFIDYIVRRIDYYAPAERIKRRQYSTKYIFRNVLLVAKEGISWKALNYIAKCHNTTITKRCKIWTDQKVFEQIWTEIMKLYIPQRLQEDKYWFKNDYIDSTMIRNLQGVDCKARNYQDKWKFGNKISTICDKAKTPLCAIFYPSNIHDIKTVNDSLTAIPYPLTINNRYTINLLADKGYRSKDKKMELHFCKVNLIANHRTNEKVKNSKKELNLLQDRHKIENVFCRLKQFRRITFRYERLIKNYIAFHFLVLSYITFPKVQL
jgi:transposase